MNETCDRCGPAVRAAYQAARIGHLYLCQHCAAQLRPALRAQGWDLWPIGELIATTTGGGSAPSPRQIPAPDHHMGRPRG
jgi:hypothetical protein